PNLLSASLFRLDPGLRVDTIVDAIEVGRVYFTDATTGIAVGDLLLFVAKRGNELKKLVMRAVAVTPEPKLKRVGIDIEALPDPAQTLPPPTVAYTVPYAAKQIIAFAKPQIAEVGFTSSNLTTTVVNKAWRESDLQAMIGIQGWNSKSLVKAVSTQPS